jgi:protease-4
MGKLFRGLWAILSGISRFISVVVPLLFVGFLIFVISQGMKEAKPRPVPDATALMINPKGVLVEDRSAKEPIEALMAESENREILLSNLIRAIEEGAEDERVKVLVLDLQQLAGPSTSQAMEISKALETFRATGKPVVAVGDFYSQGQYLLAAQADHVLLHPLGTVMLQGFGVYRSYLREFLDNIMVNMHVFRVGENKSAVEPYLRDDMSEVEREVVQRWVGGLWTDFVASVETAREMPAGSIEALLSDFPGRLKATGGDMAQLALDAGLVDQLLDHTEANAFITELVGDSNDDGEYTRIDFDGYLYTKNFGNPAALENAGKPVIAVVPIEGEIIPGESTQGMVGSETVVKQLERAAAIENLGALVLRINSPGGSVFASEVMRRKILEIKGKGVPVVVSMASVAASGGYYIAADADRIVAQPTTITGSIGVFAAFPTVERLMDYAGIHTDGVGTTPLAGSMRPRPTSG